MSVLNIYRDDGFVAEQVLMRASVSLGRHPENDIVLDDRTLSRFHARVERRGDRYVVIDLGAQNGVYLNGTRITGESGLTPGDRIGLGRYVAIFDPQAADGRQRREEEGFEDDRTGLLGSDGVELDVDLDDIMVEEAPQEATAPHGAQPAPRSSRRQSDELLDALDSVVDAPVVSDLDVDVDFGDDEGFEDPTTAIAKPQPQAAPQGPPVLVLLYNQLEVSRHPFDGDEMVVGRSKQCDVVISLLGLSRRHARLVREEGRIVVDDLGSQNGTWVNNVRIEGRRPLEHGDLMNFYEYGLLFLEDPNAQIQLPGVEFNGQAPDDALALQETGQRGPPTLQADGEAADAPPPSSLPINDPVAARAEGTGAGFDFDALGQGAFLEDAFDGATPDGSAPLEEELVEPEPTGAHEEISAISDAALLASLNLEGDVDSYTGAAEYTAATGKSPVYDADKTAYSTVPRLGDEGLRGAWPSDVELEEALARRGQRKLMSLEVYLDDDLYTQMPLSMDVTRVGTDARCEVALPSAAGLAGWQMTVVRFGATAILYRASSNARIILDDVAIDQAVLRDGDIIQLGRLKIVFKCR